MRHQSLHSWSEIWKNIRFGARVARHVGRVPHLHEHKVSARTFTLLCSQCSLTPFRTVILSPTLKILSSFYLMESQACLKGDEYAPVEIRSWLNHHNNNNQASWLRVSRPPWPNHCHHLADRNDDMISCSSLQVLRRRPPGGRTGFKVST